MTPTLLQFSAVVAGQAHNPTILNPDFLAAEGIVPKSWDWEVDDTLTTPPFAVVRYKNGVTVTVEPFKLQVMDPNVEDGPERSKVDQIASAYVKTLKYVHYTGVGNNFQTVLRIDSPERFLKSLFLKEGPWSSGERALDTIGIKLVYSLKPGKLTLAIDSGTATFQDQENQQPVLLLSANFNRDCTQQPSFEEICQYLGYAMQDWTLHQSLLNDIMETGHARSN